MNIIRLTKEQMAILKHTSNNGLYCGDSEDMQELIKLQLMKPAGKKSFVPDPYFAITEKGREYLYG